MAGLTELINVVKNAAPVMAGILGGNGAALAVSLLGNLFGKPTNTTISELLEAIKSTPDYEIKLKTLEYQYKESLAQVAVTNYQTEVDDRKSARTREIALHDYVPTLLALGFLVNYAIMQFYCVTHENAANDIISARFQDVLIMIISYYFGSSHKKPE